MAWKPIEDLPPNWVDLSDGELIPLRQYWSDQQTELDRDGVLEGFLGRLRREWSIETGQIEGVYNLDRGITQTLIERGINADLIPHLTGQRTPELIAAIINDHEDVLEGLFQFVKGERPISRGYINELHAALLRHQDTASAMDQFGHVFEAALIRGRYKERPNNPSRPDGTLIHEYCPPEHVASEMDRLLAMHDDHLARNVPVETEAAWLHHRFAQIHPYQDGNGRVARAIASLIFLRAGWFPLVVTRDDRARYIDALEVADEGDLRALVAFFVDVQKRALFQATQVAADLQPAETVDEAIAAAKKVLAGPGRSLDPSTWIKTRETADNLLEIVADRLTTAAESLRAAVTDTNPAFQFRTSPSIGLVHSSDKLGYKANAADYNKGHSLSITSHRHVFIRVQAHAIGSKYRGLIGVGVFFYPGTGEAKAASLEPFQVNYVESPESAERRFRPWLERSLARALNLWRQSL